MKRPTGITIIAIVYIVLAVLALDWLNRRTTLRILATAFGAGLAADLVKMMIERNLKEMVDESIRVVSI